MSEGDKCLGNVRGGLCHKHGHPLGRSAELGCWAAAGGRLISSNVFIITPRYLNYQNGTPGAWRGEGKGGRKHGGESKG